jgi:hypothetical protein
MSSMLDTAVRRVFGNGAKEQEPFVILRQQGKDTGMTTATNPNAVPGNNRTPFERLIDATEQFGERHAHGADVFVQHLLSCTQAAFDGIIDNTENKHGAGLDDAAVISEAYWRARNKNVRFDPKAGNQRKTISNVRTVITLGGWSKGGSGEPMGMLNAAMTLYQNLRKNPATAKGLKDAGNYLIDIARRMKKSDHILELEELDRLARKPTPDVATVAEVLANQRKTLKKLYDGKHTAGVCKEPEIEAAIKQINKLLKRYADGKRAETDAVAATEIAAEADKIAATEATTQPAQDTTVANADATQSAA